MACSQAPDKRRDTPTTTGGDDGGGLNLGNVGTIRQRCEESQPGAPILRRLTRQELENSIGDVFPEISGDWGGVQLGPDPNSKLGFANDATRCSWVTAWPKDSRHRWRTWRASSLTTRGCRCCSRARRPRKTRRARRSSLQSTVRDSSKAAHRRRADELAAYHASVTARATFALGTKWTLVAMMQSPHAVYRSELGDGKGSYAAGQTYPLTQHQIASELAYTFGGTTPSADLLAKADKGQLRPPTRWSSKLASCNKPIAAKR